MIVGMITTKDVISHPLAVLEIAGFLGFLRILSKAVSFKKYPFINSLFSCILCMALLFGCGGGAGEGDDTGELSEQTPSGETTLRIALDPSGEEATASLVNGREITVYKANPETGEDELIGSCETGSDGQCVVSAESGFLGDNPSLFVTADVGLDAMVESEMVPGTEVEITLDEVSDLALEAYRGACNAEIGFLPSQGDGLSSCLRHIIPSCIDEAIRELAAPADESDEGSLSAEFGELLEVHAKGLSDDGAVPDLGAIFSGNATAISDFQNKVETDAELERLLDDSSSVLNHVVETFCHTDHAEDFEKVTDSVPEGSRFVFFGQLTFDEMVALDPSLLRKTIVAVAGVENGGNYLSNRLAGRTIIESLLLGGVTADMADDEIKRRMELLVQVGAPESKKESQEVAQAANTVFESATFQQKPESLPILVATLKDPEKREDVVTNGVAAVEEQAAASSDTTSKDKTTEQDKTTSPETTRSCTSPLFSVSPLSLTDLHPTQGITPLGALNPTAHTFPTYHLYFMIKDSDGDNVNPVDNVNVHAPAEITVTQIDSTEYLKSGKTDYSITFFPCDKVLAYYNHLATISSDLQAVYDKAAGSCRTYDPGDGYVKRCSRKMSFELKAGAVVGTAGGKKTDSVAMDFGVRDSRRTSLTFANPDRLYADPRGFDLFHVACPIDYYDKALKGKLEAKVNRVEGAEPVCGVFAQDVANRAQGKWYVTGTTSPTDDESNHLALVHDNKEPAKAVLSVGNTKLGTGLYYFRPALSGTVNRDFADVGYDGNTLCIDSLADRFGNAYSNMIYVLKMTASATLKIEKQNAASCGTGPWSFGGSAVTFDR